MPRSKKTSTLLRSSRPPRGGLAAQVAAAKEGLAGVATKARRSRSATSTPRVRRSRAKVTAEPATDGVAPKPAISTHARGKLGQLFGFSVVSCIKAAGRDGATLEEVKNGMAALGLKAKPATIAQNLRLGKNGGEAAGKIATLTRDQLDQVRAQGIIKGTEGVDSK